MDRIFTRIANRTAAFAGQPAAFVTAFLSIIFWDRLAPCSDFPTHDNW
jgi:low affinity Fe/Cu permease